MPLTLHVERLTRPAIVVHGGAGAYLQTTTRERRIARSAHLLDVARRALDLLTTGGAGRAAVLAAIAELELDPRYNAGLGSRLQRDGVARLSAAIMDGAATRLGAVYNVRDCLHPSRLAAALLDAGDRNLDAEGARNLMVELGVQARSVVSPESLARWRDLVAQGDTADAEGAIGNAGHDDLQAARAAGLPVPEDLEALRELPPEEDRYGTVGAVAVEPDGGVWACTSTGGRGHESVGRISDSPTPAGNYACPVVAISATGFGEQILDLNVCGRIATRVLDGATLEAALRRTFAEVEQHGGLLGVIAVTRDGEAGYAHTTEACGVAWCDGAGRAHVDVHGRP